ncbi:hypothetical protein THOM_2345 [Trachipleistophora hominis]|uniref:Uncharacterized protein n=1 Tax=Trachipleistophora hominis TaxID=72359 RepID=L7JVI3_TRAHO|nr:hypothetical protein THOM_2345 [Trachipleistophora hominis]
MTGVIEHNEREENGKGYATEIVKKFAAIDVIIDEFDTKIYEKINEIKEYRNNLEESIRKFKEKRNKKMREIYDIVSSL